MSNLLGFDTAFGGCQEGRSRTSITGENAIVYNATVDGVPSQPGVAALSDYIRANVPQIDISATVRQGAIKIRYSGKQLSARILPHLRP